MMTSSTGNFTLTSHLSQRQDSALWARFLSIYGRHVVQWGVCHGLRSAEAREVADDLLLRFWRLTDRFTYYSTQSFRIYLREMTGLAWTDWRRRYRPRRSNRELPAALALLRDLSARNDLQNRLEQAFDSELFQVAMRQVKPRIEPQAWEAFRLLALEHRTGREAAEILGMQEHTAICDRNKIQHLIRETAKQIEERGPNL